MNSELLIALLGFAVALVAVIWAVLERGRADRAEARVADLQATAARVQVIEEMAARNAELLQADIDALIDRAEGMGVGPGALLGLVEAAVAGRRVSAG